MHRSRHPAPRRGDANGGRLTKRQLLITFSMAEVVKYVPSVLLGASQSPDEDPLVVKFQPIDEGKVLDLDWSSDGQSLAYGHSLGVCILTRQPPSDGAHESGFQAHWQCTKSYQYLGSPAEIVRFEGVFVAAAHPDYTISLVDATSGELSRLVGSNGHRAAISDIDLTSNGLVASVGLDRNLVVWENGTAFRFRLDGPGQKVRFWDDNNSDRVVVVDGTNRIRILDWRRGSWLLTIYTGQDCGPIQEIGIYNNDVLVIGDGWWKRYNLSSLSGGCGYTHPFDSGTLGATSHSKGMYKFSRNQHIGYASGSGAAIYDLVSFSEHGSQVEYSIPSPRTIALRPRGDVLAVGSGNGITLVRNRYLGHETDDQVVIVD